MGPTPNQVPRAWGAAVRCPSTPATLIMGPATPSVLFRLELPSPRPLLSVFFAEKQLLTGPGWTSD